ncbi:hypothetical protein [Kitasatospora sp. NPDC096140]|uniref:hypothetical protein n=1 Tax=Kitasatospora sp. NPDC096140 TaxID=3155425 RepID=UPI0033306850
MVPPTEPQPQPDDRPFEGKLVSASAVETGLHSARLLRAARDELATTLGAYFDEQVWRTEPQLIIWRGAERQYEEVRWEAADWDARPVDWRKARRTYAYRWVYRTRTRTTYVLTMTVTPEGVVELEGEGNLRRLRLPVTAEGVDSFLGPVR